jgi:hypothetical protein
MCNHISFSGYKVQVMFPNQMSYYLNWHAYILSLTYLYPKITSEQLLCTVMRQESSLPI